MDTLQSWRVCAWTKQGRHWWGTKVGKFPRDGRMIWESEKAQRKFPPLTLSQAALRRRQQASASCMETRTAYGWHLLRPHPLGPLLLGPLEPGPFILGPLHTWHLSYLVSLAPKIWRCILGPVKMGIHAPSQKQIGWKFVLPKCCLWFQLQDLFIKK